jgi:hypothetical protein
VVLRTLYILIHTCIKKSDLTAADDLISGGENEAPTADVHTRTYIVTPPTHNMTVSYIFLRIDLSLNQYYTLGGIFPKHNNIMGIECSFNLFHLGIGISVTRGIFGTWPLH